MKIKSIALFFICISSVAAVAEFSFNSDSTSFNQSNIALDTSGSYLLKNHPPFYDEKMEDFVLRNERESFVKAAVRGGAFTVGFQAATLSLSWVLLSNDFTNWSADGGFYGKNFKTAFTRPPVMDNDPWYVNYVGHSYQGSYYYNAYRSQGAKVWKSAIMSAFHSTAWEYLIESNFERPSIQDLIITPTLGSALGELTHFLTLRMSRNGFTWHEAVIVSIINPMFVLNNGFGVFNRHYEFK